MLSKQNSWKVQLSKQRDRYHYVCSCGVVETKTILQMWPKNRTNKKRRKMMLTPTTIQTYNTLLAKKKTLIEMFFDVGISLATTKSNYMNDFIASLETFTNANEANMYIKQIKSIKIHMSKMLIYKQCRCCWSLKHTCKISI